MLANRAQGTALFEVLTIRRGVIEGRKGFRVQLDADVFEEFIRRFYAQNPVPSQIIVNERFWESDGHKILLEEYFSTLKGSPVEIALPERGERRDLVNLAEKNAALSLEEDPALLDIQEALNLPNPALVIECFDISNLGEEYIVAGMVRWVNASPDKKGYRRFIIRSLKDRQDDVAAMREVVYRRYRRLKEEGGALPHLILIDGGQGQLAAALSALEMLGVHIPVVALAKRNEELFVPKEDCPRALDKNGRMMLLLRRIRDSVHEYVLAYNRKRRQMRLREKFR